MKGGKQAGAVAIPKLTPSMENELRKSIRQIAKAYIVDEHPIAGSLDGVVTLVRKHLPSLSEEDIWRYLSDRYHRVLLDSDLQRRESQAFMRRIQAAADYRNKTLLEKGFAQAGALLNTTQRGLQTSMDLSAPFRQGRRVMVTKEWVNAWLPSTKAMFAKDPQKAMELHSAELARSPYYSKGVESGLGISSASKPEEVWAGRLLQDWAAGKGLAAGKANPLRAYANLIQRSEAHYTIFLNDLRMRLFENLAKRNPNDKGVSGIHRPDDQCHDRAWSWKDGDYAIPSCGGQCFLCSPVCVVRSPVNRNGPNLENQVEDGAAGSDQSVWS